MNPLELVGAALAGGIGAGLRFVVDAAVMRGRRGAFPVGILLVNVTGSFALGLVTGLLSGSALAIVGVGLLGGYTTFGTVCVESALLARRGRRDWAWTNLVGTLVGCVIAAGAGVALGALITG